MLTIKQLQHLSAIRKAGSLQAASEIVHLSQSALTRSLMNLEDYLGVSLFDRHKTGVTPTPFCDNILAQCQQVLRDVDDIRRSAQIYKNLEQGELNIGVGKASASLINQNILPRFISQHPKINISVVESTPEDLAMRLQQHDIDLIIAGTGSYHALENTRFELLQNIPLAVFIRPSHPLATEQQPSWQQLLAYPLAGPTSLPKSNPLLKMLAEMDSPDTELPAIMCGDYQALKNILLVSDCWLIAPQPIFTQEVSAGELVQVDVSAEEMLINLSVITLEKRQLTPMADKFIDIAKQWFTEQN